MPQSRGCSEGSVRSQGVLPAYDELERDMERKEEQLERCLNNLRSDWKMRNLIFVHSKFKYAVGDTGVIQTGLRSRSGSALDTLLFLSSSVGNAAVYSRG